MQLLLALYAYHILTPNTPSTGLTGGLLGGFANKQCGVFATAMTLFFHCVPNGNGSISVCG